MRVLHVINQFCGRGGAEVSLREIVLGTQAPELQHGIAVLDTGLNRFEGLAEAGIPTYEPPSSLRSRIRQIRHVRGAIRSFRPDLVHTTLFDADLAGRVAAKMARVPALTSLVNTPYVPEAVMDTNVSRLKMGGVRLIDTMLSRYATDAFHAITETVASWAIEYLGIDPMKITVVPRGRSRAALGTPSGERRREVRGSLGLSDQTPVLINVARQEAQKGQRFLLEALVDVRRRHPDVVLLLAGREGNRTAALRRAVTGLSLGDTVRELGVRTDVPDLRSASDVFVFPSLYEGLGGAVLEAMALEVPIVASDVPAIKEVVDGDRCAILVPIRDSRALAKGICSVLTDPASAAERAAAAARKFDATYELEISLEGMRRLYESLT